MVREETRAQLKRRKVLYALRLRQCMTEAEKVLWNIVRNRRLHNLKFRRQAPVSWFVVDFLCMEKSLIIELDGSIHDQQKIYDQEREEELKSLGYRILRFTNDDILHKLDQSLLKIKATISISSLSR